MTTDERTRDDVLVTANELQAALASEHPPVVLDVRWQLDRPDGRADYTAGHIPGAVYVSLDDELAAHGAPADGRHPLPTLAALEKAARRWGVRSDSTVVVTDDSSALAASRAWWLLRAAGFDAVRILDGGLAAWRAAGLPLEHGDVIPEAGDVELRGALAALSIDEAAGFPEHGVLIDARAGARYRGENEPVDPRAGHIPGAVNRPTVANLTEAGSFRPASELRDAFHALGIEPGTSVAAYCGSGVTAAHEIAALAVAGFDAELYAGSWSQWSNHGHRPVETGDPAKPV